MNENKQTNQFDVMEKNQWRSLQVATAKSLIENGGNDDQIREF